MEDNYGKILSDGYGLKFYGGNRTRTGFLCKTNDGPREIKIAQPQKEAVQFEYDVKEHLYSKGFNCISRFCLTNDAKPYYQTEHNAYILERPALGQPMEESSPDTFLAGVRELARLHKAGSGVISTAECSNLGNLPTLCAKRKNELIRIKKRIDHQGSYSTLDILILQNFAYCMQHIEYAEKLFESPQFKQAMVTAKNNRLVCHNTYKGENIRKNDNGDIFITGFGKCAYDSPMADLASYLQRCIKKADTNSQGIANAFNMLELYQEALSITPEDKAVLLSSLIYPEKFLRLMNQYYNKRQVCVSPAMRDRLENCIVAQKKTDALVKCLITYFN